MSMKRICPGRENKISLAGIIIRWREEQEALGRSHDLRLHSSVVSLAGYLGKKGYVHRGRSRTEELIEGYKNVKEIVEVVNKWNAAELDSSVIFNDIRRGQEAWKACQAVAERGK